MDLTDKNETQQPHRDYVHGWILKIAAAVNVDLPEASQAVYLERLQRLTGSEMKTAGDLTIEEWQEPSKMPTLAFILERKGGDVKLMAEQAWNQVSRLIGNWYADGIGWQNGADKKLTPAMEYAIRQCGGEYRMAYPDDDSLPFIRRDFIAAHERFQVEDGAQVRLTKGEAAQFLSGINAQLLEWPK